MRSKPSEIGGVPTLLRTVTRWAVVAVASAALVGQLTGVRLVSPAHADGPPSPADCVGICDIDEIRLFVCEELLGIDPFHPSCRGQCVRLCQAETGP